MLATDFIKPLPQS